MIQQLVQHTAASQCLHRLAWVLVHSLWQAALCAAALWLILKLLPARRFNLRYTLSAAALLLVVLTASATWTILGVGESRLNEAATPQPPHPPHVGQPVAVSFEKPSGTFIDVPSTSTSAQSASFAGHWWNWMVMIWAAGVALMLARAARTLGSVRRLLREAHPLGEESAASALVGEVRQSLRLRKIVRVFTCEYLDVPGVIGTLWPALLLPPAVLTGMPVEQLRIIIAHELAHIRRHDFLVNLVQLLIESLLFFNPSVWWISRQVRIEREACCDALAARVAAQGRVGVARAVLEFAERFSATQETMPAAMAAWTGGHDERGTLLARLRRLLAGSERPAIRLPWYGLLIGLASAAIILAGLTWGTNVAVVAAADLLTPERWVEKLRELQETHRPSKSSYGPADRITISGSVRTVDGEPPPQRSIQLLTQNATASSSYSVELDAEGRFEQVVEFGTVYLRAQVDGYAPVFAGPLTTEPGGRLQDVDLVLDRGFTAKIQIANERGQAIVGADMDVTLHQGNSIIPFGHFVSDASGDVAIEHATDKISAQLDLRAKGFQFDRRELTLKPDDPVAWPLLAAAPTSGRIVDRDSGAPIAEAKIMQAARKGFADRFDEPRAEYGEPVILATSDQDGRFVLDTLRDDCQYALYIKAPNARVALVQNVRAGQQDVMIRLGPPLYVRGKITGDLSKLHKSFAAGQQHPVIAWRNPIKLDEGSYSYGFNAPVELRDGVGHFLLEELFPGRFEVSANNKQVELDLKTAIDDLVIDLDATEESAEAEATSPSRKVILRFNPPPDHPQPQGKIRADYVKPNNLRSYHYNEQELSNGQVAVDVPVPPGLLRYSAHELVGYWFGPAELTIPTGDEPHVIDVPVHPAGAIVGRVLGVDGQPARANINVIVVEKSPEALDRGPELDQPSADERTGKFLVARLPLGGKYRIVASNPTVESQARTISDVLTVNRQQPIQEVELRFAEGQPVHGQILGSDDQPLAGIELSLNWDSTHSHGFGGATRMTDRLGRFRFERVNPDLPGSHYLDIRPSGGYRGQRVPLTVDGAALTIRLQPGHTITGTVTDHATGWPIAQAKVVAQPADYSRNGYGGTVETISDTAGRFTLGGLEDREYYIRVQDANPPGTKIERLPTGGTRTTVPPGASWPRIVAGKDKTLKIPVTLPPDSRLQVVKPLALPAVQ